MSGFSPRGYSGAKGYLEADRYRVGSTLNCIWPVKEPDPLWGEGVKRSIDWLIKRLIKWARVSYHAWRWYDALFENKFEYRFCNHLSRKE